MKFSMFFCLAVVVFAAQAGATWGMKYQVNDGSGWTSQLTVNVATGPKSIDFRVIGYHDGDRVGDQPERWLLAHGPRVRSTAIHRHIRV